MLKFFKDKKVLKKCKVLNDKKRREIQKRKSKIGIHNLLSVQGIKCDRITRVDRMEFDINLWFSHFQVRK